MLRVLTILAIVFAATHAHSKVLIFAAASMTEVVDELATAFKDKTGIDVVGSYAGTGQLARQINAGAPADVFISADQDWMNWLTQRGHIDGDTSEVVASNQLVVAVRQEVENWADIHAMLTGSRFAMGDPASVPAGKYARQALQKIGVWDQAKANAVYGENVRLVMKRVELGEVEAAIVYTSDVQHAKNLRVAMTFNLDAHEPIFYRAGLVKTTRSAAHARKFLEFMKGLDAEAIFKKAGFTASGN